MNEFVVKYYDPFIIVKYEIREVGRVKKER